MQSCLEKRGIEERKNEIVRSDYNINDQYSSNHDDAISNGDAFGKGSKEIKGHSHWLPNCNENKYKIDYSNFDTEHAGSECDIRAREESIVRSLYKKGISEYSASILTTDENINDGQYYFSDNRRNKKDVKCPIK